MSTCYGMPTWRSLGNSNLLNNHYTDLWVSDPKDDLLPLCPPHTSSSCHHAAVTGCSAAAGLHQLSWWKGSALPPVLQTLLCAHFSCNCLPQATFCFSRDCCTWTTGMHPHGMHPCHKRHPCLLSPSVNVHQCPHAPAPPQHRHMSQRLEAGYSAIQPGSHAGNTFYMYMCAARAARAVDPHRAGHNQN
jgi:hypothetical protein